MVYGKRLFDDDTCLAEFSNHLAAYEAMCLVSDEKWTPAYAKSFMDEDDKRKLIEVKNAINN